MTIYVIYRIYKKGDSLRKEFTGKAFYFDSEAFYECEQRNAEDPEFVYRFAPVTLFHAKEFYNEETT